MIKATRMVQIAAIRLAIPSLALLLLAASACGSIDKPAPEKNPFNVESELVTGAGQAESMEFAPDGRLFFVEHWTGDIRILDAEGNPLPEPFAHLDVAADFDTGLTGIALDPDFATNHFVYALYTQIVAEGTPRVGKPTIVRFTDENNRGTSRTLITDNFPEISESPFKVNGRIHFGPDGYLYVTLGDYDRPNDKGPNAQPLPQDLGSPIGKVLRLNKDGSPAPGNPFANDPTADPRVFATGFRAAFDFTFQPSSGAMYGADSTGTSCEEINIIEAGKAYGWPEAGPWPFADCEAGKQTPAAFRLSRPDKRPEDFDSTVAVWGMEFISGDKYPTLTDSLLLCESIPHFIVKVSIPAPAGGNITASEAIVEDCWGDITTSPDGTIYYSNLNEIRRLIPGPAQAETPQQ